MQVTNITKRQKSSSSKVKSEDYTCVFLWQQGNYSPRVCPWGTNCHRKFLFECSGTPMEEDSPWPARVLSWFLLHDNATVHRAVAVQEFLARKQVCVLNDPPYSPDLSPCVYFLFPKLKLPLKGRHFEDVQDPRSCDIETSGHTTRRCAEVVPVFARSCHMLYQCRRNVLWIKYR